MNRYYPWIIAILTIVAIAGWADAYKWREHARTDAEVIVALRDALRVCVEDAEKHMEGHE